MDMTSHWSKPHNYANGKTDGFLLGLLCKTISLSFSSFDSNAQVKATW